MSAALTRRDNRTRASSVCADKPLQQLQGLSSVYLLQVDDGMLAYQYDVEIWAQSGQRKSWCLTGGKSDLNRRISVELVRLALDKTQRLNAAAYVYSGYKNLYSASKIIQGPEIKIHSNEVSEFVQSNFDNKQITFKVDIKPCDTHFVLVLNDLSQYKSGNSVAQEDRSLRTFFELAIAQKAMESNNYIAIGPGKIFKRSPEFDFYRGIITFHSGVCKGVRIVEGNPGRKMQAAIVLDAKLAAFMKSQSLDKTIEELLRTYRNNSERVEQFLRGVKVQCVYNKSRHFAIGGFGGMPLAEESFEQTKDDVVKRVSLVDYFKSTWNITLKNVKLPGVYPLGRQFERFPAEQLIILEGQKISQEKQTPDLVDILLKKNTVKPDVRQHKIENCGRELALWNGEDGNGNNVLRTFGIKVQKTSNDADIELRPLPQILYKNNKDVTPSSDKGEWTRNTGVYMEMGNLPQKWVLLYHKVHEDVVKKFLKLLQNKCREKGMTLADPIASWPRAQDLFDGLTKAPKPEEWRKCFAHCTNYKYEFLLMIDSKANDSHGLLKLFEVFEKGSGKFLLTQQVTYEVAERVVRQNQQQTLENIVNKLNSKFGGLNYEARMPTPVDKPGLAKFEQRFNLRSGNILVIGYDVSHPTQKAHELKRLTKLREQSRSSGRSSSSSITAASDPSLASEEGGQEQQQQIEEMLARGESTIGDGGGEDQSVVGICANTTSNPNNFVGDYFFQAARRECVDCDQLRQRAQWILRQLAVNRPKQARPEYVFILRDGLSEGQFDMAYRDELAVIRNGFRAYDPKYAPKLVLVIGTKRHFKKFFTYPSANGSGQNLNAPVANMPPGSIIQRKVVRPDVLEFYLQTHFPIQGTGQAVEYAVLCNDIQFRSPVAELKEYAKLLGYKKATQDELEKLMFQRSLYSLLSVLAFSHQIVPKPISLPEPVFQADELAKRGRDNLMTLKRFFPNQVPYLPGSGGLVMDSARLTQMLSYWNNGEAVLQKRFNA